MGFGRSKASIGLQKILFPHGDFFLFLFLADALGSQPGPERPGALTSDREKKKNSKMLSVVGSPTLGRRELALAFGNPER